MSLYDGIFERTEILIGKDSLSILKNSKVLAVGIGGVGSFTVEALARSGIGSLVLVDNKCIDITNINRQIHSNIYTIGRPKVEVMKERIMGINPNASVITHNEFFSKETSHILLDGDLDYIVDAIDSIESKIELILEANKLQIPIMSSMGAGNKLDPTKFIVADIYKTDTCPLARVMRKELKKRQVKSLKVVYSSESPIKVNSPFPASVSFVPSVAGLIIAGEVIKDLIKKKSCQEI